MPLGTGYDDLYQQGMLDRHVLPPGSLAIIGPGVLHSVHGGRENEALRLVVVPARGFPLKLLRGKNRQETLTPYGLRIYL